MLGSKQKVLAVGAVAALALLASGGVAAAIPGTATITGGSLAMTAPASVEFSATLNGSDQTALTTQLVNVVDSAGTGAGWNVTLTSTTFVSGADSLPNGSVTDTAAAGACASGVSCTLATNSVTYPLTVPAGSTAPTAVKIVNAAVDTGMGSQDWTHNMALALLGSVKAGAYASTWTYSLVSAP